MTAILGISAFYHDSAAALVVDGEIVAAAQEERFTRKKHDPGFPAHAVAVLPAARPASTADRARLRRLLRQAAAQVRAAARDLPRLRARGLPQLQHGDAGLAEGEAAAAGASSAKAWAASVKAPLVFTDHHESHAASAFFPSPFDEAAILTLDGVGEWSTTTMGVGRGNRIELTHAAAVSALARPAVLGVHLLLRLQGQQRRIQADGPGAVRPARSTRTLIPKHLIDLKPDGSFWLDMEYFNYCQGLTMTNGRFDELFGGPPRDPESDIEQRHMDLAASIQAVTEDVDAAHGPRAVIAQTGHEAPGAGRRRGAELRRPTAGCCAKGRSTTSGSSPPPATPAARSAPRCSSGISCSRSRGTPQRRDRQKGSFLGPRFSTAARSAAFLDGAGATYQQRHRRGRPAAAGRRPAGDGQDRRLVPGPDGVRPARARRAQHPRRPAVAEDAGDDEPEDQVPRELPAVRAGRAAGATRTSGSTLEPGQESPYMLLVAPVLRRAPACRSPTSSARRWQHDPDLRNRVNVAALDDSGGHARRLQRADPDRGRGAQSAASPAAARRSSRGPAARCW